MQAAKGKNTGWSPHDPVLPDDTSFELRSVYFKRCRGNKTRLCRILEWPVLWVWEGAFGSYNTFAETWLDFEIDTLYLNWGSRGVLSYVLQDLKGVDLDRVRYLTLDIKRLSFGVFECEEDRLDFLLWYWPKVEKISLSWRDLCHMDTETANIVIVKPVSFNLSMESVDSLLNKTTAQDYHHFEALQRFEARPPPINRRMFDEYVAKEVAHNMVPRPLPEITREIFTTAVIDSDCSSQR
ncbi:hypothetical protein IFR05_009692 [Cadophora sp. M221]|nr:hypothetical protein IFR05_009692 [Cadophora sp. M221]